MKFPLFALLLTVAPVFAAAPDDADKRIVQAVQRLSAFDYDKAAPRTKDAINRYLDATAGSTGYFQLVEKFRVVEQRETLLRLAVEQSSAAAGGEAVKLLFQLGHAAAVQEKFAALEPSAAAKLAECVAGVGTKDTTEWSAAILAKADAPAALREAVVKGMARHPGGQQALLAAAQANRLPESVKPAVALALATSTDEAIRSAAGKVLPVTAAATLPPVAELAKRTGDAAKGQPVFMAYCFSCHQVNGLGIDFGPALSEIGSKLAREALYDSILNPGAGISFGFEGWEVKTKDGNTFIGIVAGDTGTELSLKVPGGIIQKCAADTIASRTKMTVSLMTPNLHTVMSQDDLVNLVEYLASLKKKQ